MKIIATPRNTAYLMHGAEMEKVLRDVKCEIENGVFADTTPSTVHAAVLEWVDPILAKLEG